jgi:hypothetical protein
VHPIELVWVHYREGPEKFYSGSIIDKLFGVVGDLCIPMTIYQTTDSVRGSKEKQHPEDYTNEKQLAYYLQSRRKSPYASKPGCTATVSWRWIANKGGEAPGYVSYILDRYESLASWTVFIHGRPTQHSRFIYELLACLDVQGQSKANEREAGPVYIPLNDAEYFTKNRTDHYWWWEPGYISLYKMWRDLGVLENMPPLESIKAVTFHPAAQFAVSRAAIKLHPHLFYEVALSAALNGYGANKEIAEKRYRQDNQGERSGSWKYGVVVQ